MKNWRTTLFGALGGIALMALPYLEGKEPDTKTIVTAVALGLLGWLAKDQHNKPKV